MVEPVNAASAGSCSGIPAPRRGRRPPAEGTHETIGRRHPPGRGARPQPPLRPALPNGLTAAVRSTAWPPRRPRPRARGACRGARRRGAGRRTARQGQAPGCIGADRSRLSPRAEHPSTPATLRPGDGAGLRPGARTAASEGDTCDRRPPPRRPPTGSRRSTAAWFAPGLAGRSAAAPRARPAARSWSSPAASAAWPSPWPATGTTWGEARWTGPATCHLRSSPADRASRSSPASRSWSSCGPPGWRFGAERAGPRPSSRPIGSSLGGGTSARGS